MTAAHASLVVTFEGQVLDEVAVGGARVTVGRGPHNTIRLDDPAVSGSHAAIAFDLSSEAGPVLEDLQSTNGVRVNGVRVARHVLKHGDIVDIGRHRLRYLEEKPLPTRALSADVARLRVLNGPDVGRETELTPPVLAIGSPDRAGAVIERRGERYVLLARGGTPPLLNGAPVGDGGVALSRGDVIELAGVRYEFLAV